MKVAIKVPKGHEIAFCSDGASIRMKGDGVVVFDFDHSGDYEFNESEANIAIHDGRGLVVRPYSWRK